MDNTVYQKECGLQQKERGEEIDGKEGMPDY